jgi:hypothetical protein
MPEDELPDRILRCQQLWKDMSDEEFLARVQTVLDPDIDAMARWQVLRELRDLYRQRARFLERLWELIAARLESPDGRYLPGEAELRRLLASIPGPIPIRSREEEPPPDRDDDRMT